MMTDAPTAPEADVLDSATPASSQQAPLSLDALSDVEIDVSVELGRCQLSLGEVARLDVGSVVDLGTPASGPLSVFANGRRIAIGEVVVVDGQLGVRIREVTSRPGA
ncbi:FliM/FliN family flagellar motor switch protein [Rubrivirga sp.]|uniref:FliM/FliN family flagellar motor switch protein n=1 Tax=Rubrivirga sp. TaxID=1885344 RepID=UPI003C7467BA